MQKDLGSILKLSVHAIPQQSGTTQQKSAGQTVDESSMHWKEAPTTPSDASANEVIIGVSRVRLAFWIVVK